jgi:hypothetical protein
MIIRGLGLVVVAALCCWGCSKGSDSRIGDLLSRQGEHAQKITEIAKKVDGVDVKLSNIEKGINALLGGGAGADAGGGSRVIGSSTFAKTEEYKNIMNQIALLQEQAGVVQGELGGFQEGKRQSRELEALRDRGGAFRAMSEPQELTRRLDILAKNFSGKRNQFVSELEALKSKFSASLSPDEKLAQARNLLTERLNSSQDERETGRLQRQLEELDQAQGAQQIEEQADRLLQFQKMREIGELTQKYSIPEETVRDSGLATFGRGGPGGFMGGGRGPGGGGPGGRGPGG